ncbi:carbon-nitrogen hydrolase family protein [Algoriphagus sanaruensis]|uniref:Acyltransferase n=1 Tax=Algoriphagus sanaruensis TaxID=1727163 RepID=A0A142EMB3_9BACT|nr:carbon-nitrogen hydrolase family protein [Algoriphagus sanaruensis]AMQ56268.1 acyltransferase [Algoriphagus sanaruensis]
MKISIAQTRPIKGDISANIDNHIKFIELASSLKATSIFFPELSLTSYEPELAKTLATTQDDKRLDSFQKISDTKKITIGLGIPTIAETGIKISMVIFQPDKPRITYSKQQLHSDEFPYFISGDEQVILNLDNKKVAPAICFESLQPNHSDTVNKLGAEIYLASVAKSQNGIYKALAHYPEVAKKYSMPVLMSNCVGFCDNFLSVGHSSVWTEKGQLAGQLDDQSEGIIVFDTDTKEVIKQTL